MPNPPLIFLCAAAALCAAAIQNTAMPLMTADTAYRTALRPLDQAGSFAANLAAISGIIALGFALLGLAKRVTWVGLPRRFSLAAFSGIFLASMTVAVLFDRQRTTTQGVLFAFAAASVLTSLLHGIAFRAGHGVAVRALAANATIMAAAALCAQLLQLWSETTLAAWHLSALNIARTVGEVAYLAVLVSAAFVVLPEPGTRAGGIGRMLGGVALVATMIGLIVAERALGRDYALVLYQNQRVSAWIDTLPSVYALPLAIAFAGSVAGLVGGDMQKRQGACGLLLLLSSGYAPPAPGRLLTLTLGLALLASVIIARAIERWAAQQAVEAAPAAPAAAQAP
jgi:hypothetical protein